MLNTKLGFFYVHRSVRRFIYEIVEVYLRERIRLSFPYIYNALRGLYCNSLATREQAAVLASIRVQENLPLTAKLLQYMKTLTQGTSSVPALRSTEECNTLQKRYYRSIQSCEVQTSNSDKWYIATIASFCATFICPPCIIVVLYCYFKARKNKEGGMK